MQKWKIVDERYLDFLRDNYEPRIPHSNYGKDKYKPFFGELFRIGRMSYISQISSPKERHYDMKDSMDFIKIYDPKTKSRLLGVINLNYMFPIATGGLEDLDYRTIDNHRTFSSEAEKSNYIRLLKMQMKQMNTLDLGKRAFTLYNHQLSYPESLISLRCFDFKMLESACHRFYCI